MTFTTITNKYCGESKNGYQKTKRARCTGIGATWMIHHSEREPIVGIVAKKSWKNGGGFQDHEEEEWSLGSKLARSKDYSTFLWFWNSSPQHTRVLSKRRVVSQNSERTDETDWGYPLERESTWVPIWPFFPLCCSHCPHWQDYAPIGALGITAIHGEMCHQLQVRNKQTARTWPTSTRMFVL